MAESRRGEMGEQAPPCSFRRSSRSFSTAATSAECSACTSTKVAATIVDVTWIGAIAASGRMQSPSPYVRCSRSCGGGALYDSLLPPSVVRLKRPEGLRIPVDASDGGGWLLWGARRGDETGESSEPLAGGVARWRGPSISRGPRAGGVDVSVAVYAAAPTSNLAVRRRRGTEASTEVCRPLSTEVCRPNDLSASDAHELKNPLSSLSPSVALGRRSSPRSASSLMLRRSARPQPPGAGWLCSVYSSTLPRTSR